MTAADFAWSFLRLMKRHEDLGDLKPAEKDILQMSEHDTACQYCGISYLILAKCEKMERLVKEMQVERDELRVIDFNEAIR